MDIFGKLVEKIVKAQEGIIGPVALDQARKVHGLKVDLQKHEVTFVGDQKDIVEKLVEQYRELFGRASVEVCKDAVKGIVSQVPKGQLPSLLQQ